MEALGGRGRGGGFECAEGERVVAWPLEGVLNVSGQQCRQWSTLCMTRCRHSTQHMTRRRLLVPPLRSGPAGRTFIPRSLPAILRETTECL